MAHGKSTIVIQIQQMRKKIRDKYLPTNKKELNFRNINRNLFHVSSMIKRSKLLIYI